MLAVSLEDSASEYLFSDTPFCRTTNTGFCASTVLSILASFTSSKRFSESVIFTFACSLEKYDLSHSELLSN